MLLNDNQIIILDTLKKINTQVIFLRISTQFGKAYTEQKPVSLQRPHYYAILHTDQNK